MGGLHQAENTKQATSSTLYKQTFYFTFCCFETCLHVVQRDSPHADDSREGDSRAPLRNDFDLKRQTRLIILLALIK